MNLNNIYFGVFCDWKWRIFVRRHWLRQDHHQVVVVWCSEEALGGGGGDRMVIYYSHAKETINQLLPIYTCFVVDGGKVYCNYYIGWWVNPRGVKVKGGDIGLMREMLRIANINLREGFVEWKRTEELMWGVLNLRQIEYISRNILKNVVEVKRTEIFAKQEHRTIPRKVMV